MSAWHEASGDGASGSRHTITMSTNTTRSPLDQFDELPIIDDPTEEDRRAAEVVLGTDAVPDVGPVPDVTSARTLERTVAVPEWLAVAVAKHLLESDTDPDETDDRTIEDNLLMLLYWEYDFQLEDGRPFAETVREIAAEIEP